VSSVLEQLQTWQAMVVALLGATLWALPFRETWPLWHHSIGLLLVLLAGLVTAAVSGDIGALVGGALQGMLGLSVSWVLIEAGILSKAIGQRVKRGRRA
jgi:hypothetical protein